MQYPLQSLSVRCSQSRLRVLGLLHRRTMCTSHLSANQIQFLKVMNFGMQFGELYTRTVVAWRITLPESAARFMSLQRLSQRRFT